MWNYSDEAIVFLFVFFVGYDSHLKTFLDDRRLMKPASLATVYSQIWNLGYLICSRLQMRIFICRRWCLYEFFHLLPCTCCISDYYLERCWVRIFLRLLEMHVRFIWLGTQNLVIGADSNYTIHSYSAAHHLRYFCLAIPKCSAQTSFVAGGWCQWLHWILLRKPMVSSTGIAHQRSL